MLYWLRRVQRRRIGTHEVGWLVHATQLPVLVDGSLAGWAGVLSGTDSGHSALAAIRSPSSCATPFIPVAAVPVPGACIVGHPSHAHGDAVRSALPGQGATHSFLL